MATRYSHDLTKTEQRIQRHLDRKAVAAIAASCPSRTRAAEKARRASLIEAVNVKSFNSTELLQQLRKAIEWLAGESSLQESECAAFCKL